MNEPKPSFWWRTWNEPRHFFFGLILFLAVLGFGLVIIAIPCISPPPVCIIGGLVDALFFMLALLGFLLALIPWTRPIMTWILRRRFFVLACLITAVALGYVEEDWRAKWAWNKYKQQEESKGEFLDFAHVVPPPVPDDQNLAMAPIVMTSYSQQLTPEGKPKFYDSNVVIRLNFSPNREDDHKALPFGSWQKGAYTDLKAWQNYYRYPSDTNSPNFKTNEFPISPRSQTPAQDVLLALSKYGANIEELRAEAARRPLCRFPLQYDRDNPAEIILPHLGQLKACASGLNLRAIAELEAGQSDKALADVTLMFRLSDALRPEPTLISYLVRLAMNNLTVDVIWEGMAKHLWSDAQLTELQAELAHQDFLEGYQFAIRGERAFGLGIIRFVRQRPLELRQLFTFNNAPPTTQSDANTLATGALIVPRSFFYFNALNIARMYQDYFIPMVNTNNQTVSPSAAKQLSKQCNAELKGFFTYHVFAQIMLPGLGHLPQRAAAGQTSVDLALTGCALERYRLAHGNYPDSLDVLTPQFITALPHDVINGQPLHYRRSDGGYILYSIGWNEKDDGGTVVLTDDSHPSVNLQEGDWVWQVPGKAQ